MVQTEDPSSAHDPGLLAAYVEGRLDDTERGAMTVHLAECEDCRQALGMLARAPGAVPAAANHKPPMRNMVWIGLAATVVLATVAIRSTDRPVVDVEAPPATLAGSAPVMPASPAATVAESKPAAAREDPLLDPGLLVKRGEAQRRVGGRVFRMRAGEWVDSAFDPATALATVTIAGPAERASIVDRVPALAPFAALGDRVIVVHEGTVYRFSP